MADEPNDPPIGTAQNAADVARKEKRWEGQAYIQNMLMQSVLQQPLPWSDAEISNAYQLAARSPDLTKSEFKLMLAYLSFCQDARHARS